MPSYDYRCNQCHRRVNLRYKTYAEYDNATPICPHCGSADLTLAIGRIAVARSDDRRFDDMAMDNNDAAFDDMADADPATLGRYMRKMGEAMGEDMGEDYHEVVSRLEHGEDPESIEAGLEHGDFGGTDGLASGGAMPDFGGDDF